MIVDSLAKCVHTYEVPKGIIDIVPGRNLIADDKGRELMAYKPFLDMVNAKTIGFAGMIRVVIPPAADPATAPAQPGGKSPAVPPTGETAVSGMSVKDATVVINECSVVDQLRDILERDPRAGIKKVCEARIAVLAAEADSGKPAGEEDDADDDLEPT